MSYVIIKGGPTHKKDNRKLSDMDIDRLHKRRLFLEETMRHGIFTKDQMQAFDCKTEQEEEKRTQDYIKWKERKTATGNTNESNMEEWHEINREFKRRGKEGRQFDIDAIRTKPKVKYE